MILTVTLNAALDVTYHVGRLEEGETHRVEQMYTQAGGKGINVARVLHELGHRVAIIGFAGGPTGAAIRADLAELDLPEALLPIDGDSRRTVTVVDGIDLATGFHEPGPRVSPAEWEQFLAGYQLAADRASVVVLSGSLPPGVPQHAYADLIRLAPDAKTIVDTDGRALAAAVSAQPDVIKPNRSELLTSTGIFRPLKAATRLREEGARAVVATLGEEGLFALTPDGEWSASAVNGLEGNPTGAGDACVAALAAGLLDGTPWEELLVEAVALSAAAVVCPVAGAVNLATYQRVRSEVEVEELRARPNW